MWKQLHHDFTKGYSLPPGLYLKPIKPNSHPPKKNVTSPPHMHHVYLTSGVPSCQTAEVECFSTHKNKPQNWVEADMSARAWASVVEVSQGKAERLLLS